MPVLKDQLGAGRHFEPSVPRIRKRTGVRSYQSMWTLSQFSETLTSPLTVDNRPDAQLQTNPGGTSAIGTNFSKHLPKWLRWGGGKKSTAENKGERGAVKAEPASSDAGTNQQQGFIGNLGIGRYIDTEDSTFVTSDEMDEPVRGLGPTNRTKSLINLSSLLLWSSETQGSESRAPTDRSFKLDVFSRTRERDSCSASSVTTSSVENSPRLWNSAANEADRAPAVHSDLPAVGPDRPPVIPELIKVLFLTNTPLGRELMDAETLRATNAESSRKPLDLVKLIIPFPAWFIHESSPIIPNMTYSLYRTSDYRDEIQRSIRWLEERVHPHQQHRSRPTTRKRSPSAPRFTADHRARRANPDSTSSVSGSSEANQRRQSLDRDATAKGASNDRSNDPVNTVFPDRAELETMLRVLSEANRFMDMLQPYSKNDGLSGENSAIVLRNSGINTSFPSAHQLILPQIQSSPMSNQRTSADLRKVFLEDNALLYKLPLAFNETATSEEFKFNEHTLLLSSNLLMLSEDPIVQRDTVTPVRFKHIFPLTQTWCHVMHASTGSSTAFSDVIKSSANILAIPKASIARFGKGLSSTYDGLASKLPRAQTDAWGKQNDTNSSASRLVWIGCPPVNNWLLQFPTESVSDRWIASLQEMLSQNQQFLEGRNLCVKILNEVTDNQVVYKYHNVMITTSANELKEKALSSMNIKGHSNCHMLARYHPTVDEERDFPLTGYESPFLISLSLTLKLCIDFTSGQSESNQSAPPSPTRTIAPNTASTTTTTAAVATTTNTTTTTTKAGQLKLNKVFDLFKKYEDDAREANSSCMDLETFARNLPATDPIIPRDQLRVEFVLQAGAKSGSKQSKKSRSSGIVKPSDLKKSAAGAAITARAQKNRRKIREKTKSTVNLNSIATMSSTIQTVPLRGARSLGSLNYTAKQGEIFGQIPGELWPEPCIPQSLMSLFVIVYHTGVNVEGIFRRTAVNSQIDAMREKVDENAELITPSMCSPILAACVLKKFFHEIPGHVLGDDNWDDWVEVLRLPTVTERVTSVRRLIRKLPKANQTLLRLLIFLLCHIRDNEAVNRMSVQALGIVWGPNLIQGPHATSNPTESKLACSIVECLLDQKMTANVLLGSPMVVDELRRLFETEWENLINSNLTGDDTLAMSPPSTQPSQQDSCSTNSDLGRSTGASAQESYTEPAESQEEHSFSSSIRLSRSELSSLEDAASRKHQHSHSSLLSTTTSSSADSQNASPILTEHRMHYSPMMNDKRRANCLPRRKLLFRTDQTLPDQMNPTVLGSTYSSSVTDGEFEWETSRVRKQISMPGEFDPHTARASPPPVPPRAYSHVVRMPEVRSVTEVKAVSPPIPPKPKPRQKPVELKPKSLTMGLESSIMNKVISTTGDEKRSETGISNDRMYSQTIQRTPRRIMYSRVSSASLFPGPGSERTQFTHDGAESNHPSRDKTRRVPTTSAYEHRVRDRRHSSADRIRASNTRDRLPPVQNSPRISKVAPIQTPTLPPYPATTRRTARIIPVAQTEENDLSSSRMVNTEPCERKHITVGSDAHGTHTMEHVDRRDRRRSVAQPDSSRRIHVTPFESIPSALVQPHQLSTVAAHRPQSVSCVNADLDTKTGPSPPADSDQLYVVHSSIKRSESETEQDARSFARCVRRMSSHASTVSSGSNTLVSTSNEQIS